MDQPRRAISILRSVMSREGHAFEDIVEVLANEEDHRRLATILSSESPLNVGKGRLPKAIHFVCGDGKTFELYGHLGSWFVATGSRLSVLDSDHLLKQVADRLPPM